MWCWSGFDHFRPFFSPRWAILFKRVLFTLVELKLCDLISGGKKSCFRGTDGQRSERQDEQLEPLRRVYHETLCNRGWCLLCLRLGAIISWSVGCRSASGSWSSSARCREQRRWRRLDYANCSQAPRRKFSREQISPLHTFHLPTSESEARPPSGGDKLTGLSCGSRSQRLVYPTLAARNNRFAR